ncbi:MAG TPA: serine hydrolase domain-containing protein [Gemmatimonadaceae bacterium]|nr:serine hydrolase domain-containing protein [Gemmatimonadaceae bacterium]
MPRPLLAFVALLLPASLTAQHPDSLRAAIDRAFAPWTAAEGPGCAVAVARDGALLHAKGYGMANLETVTPITPSSVFHLASVSKQFTAFAILLLEKEGRLSLDEDIRKHLPEIPDLGHRITIRHLLHHTSGLRDQWDLLIMARGRFEENRITTPDVLEIVSRQKALNFTPGAEYLYSNTGYTLAAEIVRRVSGKSLRDFSAERIFRPLGMTETQWQDDYTRVVRNRAAAYARQRDGAWHVSLPNYDTYGATSLFSTVGDLLRWQRNFDSVVVGDRAILDAMRRRPVLANGDTSDYGLGLSMNPMRGVPMIAHGGADAGYRTMLARLPEQKLDVVVLCNAASANPGELALAAARPFLPQVTQAAATTPTPPVTVAVAEMLRHAGVYRSHTGSLLFVSVRGDSLFIGRTSGPTLVPIGPRRFRVTGQPDEAEFLTDGTMLQHFPGRRAPARWTRHEPVRRSDVVLTDYAGTYHSEELGATYTVTPNDSGLVLRTRWSNEMPITPVYRDTFGGRYLVDFTRANGTVDGFLVSSGRVRKVRFTRVAASPQRP